MRRNKINWFALVFMSLMLSGCGAYAIAPVTGFLYSDVSGPLGATGRDGGELTVGEAECTSILGLIATGDCSIEAAMQNGGITTIHHVDFRSNSILGVYARFTVIVYGD